MIKCLNLVPVRSSILAFVAVMIASVGRSDWSARAEMPRDLLVATEVVHYTDYAPQLTLTGTLNAQVQADLSFKIGGQITERLADVGDHLRAGDLLARIDDSEQQANLRAAKAAQDAAQAELTQATAHYKRQQQLLAQGFTTRSQFEQAEQAWITAKNDLTSAESQYENAVNELADTELRSPVDGIITARHVEVGQVVQAAQSGFSLAQDGARDAIFDVQEVLVKQIGLDADVTITLLADEAIKAQAKVREIAPVVDAQTGTVKVKVALADDAPELPLGSIISGTLQLPPQKAASLTWSALTSMQGSPAVWRVNPDDNLVSLVPVEVLSYAVKRVMIASGVAEGDVVVAKGGQMLRSKQRVETTVLQKSGAETQ